MNRMIKDLYLIEKIIISEKANGLIYFVKKLPWIGKRLSDDVYKNEPIKIIGSIIFILLHILRRIAGKVLYLVILVALPLSLRYDVSGAYAQGFLYVFILLSCISRPLVLNETTYPQKKEYIIIALMHMDAKRYVRVRHFINILLPGVTYLLIFLICMPMLGLSIWYAPMLALCYCGWLMFGEALHLWYFQYHKKPLCSTFIYVYPAAFFFFVCAYVPIYFEWSFLFHAKLWCTLLLIYASLGAIFAFFYIKTVDFTAIMRKGILVNKDIYTNAFQKESLRASEALKDKDYTKEELREHKFANKQGYEYLNALFFQRHKRLFYRPMRNRIIGLLVLFLALDVLALLLKEEMLETIESPLRVLPAMLFLLYFISIGERMTRVMFYNCDVSLLHYGYYKEKNAILTNFKIRLRKVIGMNMILAVLICIGTLSFLLCAGKSYPLIDIVLFILSTFTISIFFSIHHLFLYYVLQPYTAELEMKSPVFALVSTGVYICCYMASKIEGNVFFAIGILVATITYCGLALLLVYRFAPKKFHIR